MGCFMHLIQRLGPLSSTLVKEVFIMLQTRILCNCTLNHSLCLGTENLEVKEQESNLASTHAKFVHLGFKMALHDKFLSVILIKI